MSKIDYQALRELAKQATQGEWVAFISTGTGTYAVHTPGDKRCEDVIKWTGFDGQKNAENNARYIAAFNPEVVRALLDERERNQQYIKTPENQTQAAINAGFSPNTAAVKASVMMRDERIQKRIAELMEERNKRMRVSADYVLMRLVEIDQMDVIDILNDDGSLKPIREWPKIWRTTLSGFDLSSTIMNMNEDSIETILKKIKWPDKVKNLELIGKHVDVNAFKERLDVNVNVTIADRIAAARKRLKERQDGNQ